MATGATADDAASLAVAGHFIRSLESADHARAPFDHWLLADALPQKAIDGIVNLPVAPPHEAAFNGTREINNSSRLFFTPRLQRRHPVCREIADAFRDREVVRALEDRTGARLARGRLRIEYCQDITGFWLAPHLDISVKLFTMLIYLSGEPELRDAGTDIYDASPEHKPVATVPYEKGKGLIFIPGSNTWHGFTQRPIGGVRKSIIVNYVTRDWRSIDELA